MTTLVRIRPTNGPGYLVKQSLIAKSEKIKDLIGELGPVSAGNHPEVYIPLRAEIVRHVLSWMFHHKDDTGPPERLNERDGRGDAETGQWDREFLAGLETGTLMELVLAADFLAVKELVDLTANAVSGLITGKTPEQIRKTFNVKKDLKPEEEEIIRRENQWCEER
ncbi:S-phase kinase-associated protein 1 [Orchesella cincta]|uniref:S-phase kinase-associated protein 1 n=1 Tax=Orchesella cincta TaxID=48709 RepID=A0A1D2MDF7_ORCCI|nr:S-phase kinase-associated protein 1 [Orchesella cincta]